MKNKELLTSFLIICILYTSNLYADDNEMTTGCIGKTITASIRKLHIEINTEKACHSCLKKCKENTSNKFRHILKNKNNKQKKFLCYCPKKGKNRDISTPTIINSDDNESRNSNLKKSILKSIKKSSQNITSLCESFENVSYVSAELAERLAYSEIEYIPKSKYQRKDAKKVFLKLAVPPAPKQTKFKNAVKTICNKMISKLLNVTIIAKPLHKSACTGLKSGMYLAEYLNEKKIKKHVCRKNKGGSKKFNMCIKKAEKKLNKIIDGYEKDYKKIQNELKKQYKSSIDKEIIILKALGKKSEKSQILSKMEKKELKEKLKKYYRKKKINNCKNMIQKVKF